jgi:hypothetical protein
MLKSIKGLRGWHRKNCRTIYRFWRWGIVKQDESNGDPKLQWQLDLEANWQVIESQT